MQLFIGRFPQNFGKEHLRRFVMRGIRGKGLLGLLQRKPTGFHCTVMVMQDRDSGIREYFAVVSHLPYKIAQRVISNLNGTHFNGKVVEVHEYRVRSWKNDRRQLVSEIQPGQTREQRIRDRRDRWTVTEVKMPRTFFEGYEQLAREYGVR